jgi:hypothetical protein
MYFVESIAAIIPVLRPLANEKYWVLFPAPSKTVVREAYLVSDQAHRRDEGREGEGAPRNVGLQDLTPNLRPTADRVGARSLPVCARFSSNSLTDLFPLLSYSYFGGTSVLDFALRYLFGR